MNKKREINDLEEGEKLQIDYAKIAKISNQCNDVIPVAVQDASTKEVILIAYINEIALQKSVETKIATFWSTSRNELWVKGATSGNYFELIDIYVNCEQNSLLFTVKPKGEKICHTKNSKGEARNCYYRRVNFDTMDLENIDR